MHQQVAAFILDVVGDDETLGNAKPGVAVKALDDLRRLGARRSAHVHHSMMRLDIHQQRRDHRHGLLAGDVAALLGMGGGEIRWSMI